MSSPAIDSHPPLHDKTTLPMPSNSAEKPQSTPQDAGRKRPDTSIKDDAEHILAAAPEGEIDLENGDGAELKRKPSTIVPRTKRRGLFAYLVIGIPEIEDPVQYSPKTKNLI